MLKNGEIYKDDLLSTTSLDYIFIEKGLIYSIYINLDTNTKDVILLEENDKFLLLLTNIFIEESING